MQSLSTWYQQQTTTGKLKFDNAQLLIMQQLDQFLVQFSLRTARPSILRKLTGLDFIMCLWPQEHKKLGYYIYGDVGRGKSMIINMMYQFTPGQRKTRLHFHEFMHDIHQQLADLTINDPLSQIAKRLKCNYDIIYLDEMHVSDIATAMILKRLLENMFANQIDIVTSSNYAPDDLWPDGLMRERFLPAIEVLKTHLQLVALNAGQDYRLFNHSINQLFIIQQPDSHLKLEQIFTKINSDQSVSINHSIKIANRNIPYLQRGGKVIWFDFSILCGDRRSQLDNLELAQQFQWLVISDIYQLTAAKKDLARRFTWLIDILYDGNRKLALSSVVLIQDIYCQGDFANEFQRTISRLEEMQTIEYVQKDLTALSLSPYNIALESI